MKKTKKSVSKTVSSPATGDRGLFLMILLVLGIIGIVLSAFALLSGKMAMAVMGMPSWMPAYQLLSVVVSAASLYGIWQWKKWGVYLLVALYLIQVVMDLSLSAEGVGSIKYSMYGGVIGTLVIAGLWYWAIYRKWSLFK